MIVPNYTITSNKVIKILILFMDVQEHFEKILVETNEHSCERRQ